VRILGRVRKVSGLAIYHKRCEEETQATLPHDLRELGAKSTRPDPLHMCH